MSRARDEWARSIYAGGRASRVAVRYARLWNRVLRLGLLPPRWVVLEVPGHRSGQMRRIPLGMADVGGRWYLVSMLGECNWVRNVRANGGRAVLRRRHARQVTLIEVAPEERAPILKRYLNKAPGGRPHFNVNRRDPIEAFEAVARDYPVFEVIDPAV